jgi:hypothetical protein
VAITAEDLESAIQLTQAANLAINGFESRYPSPPGKRHGMRKEGDDFNKRFSTKTG